MSRTAMFVLVTAGVVFFGWLMFTAASFSGRQDLDRKLILIVVPIALIGAMGGLALLFSSGFRRPERPSSILVDRVRAAIHTVVAVIVGVIVCGVALYLYRLERDEPVAPVVVKAADFLVTPFRSIFVLENNYWQVPLNWGLGAIVYIFAGLLLSAAVGALANARQPRTSE